MTIYKAIHNYLHGKLQLFNESWKSYNYLHGIWPDDDPDPGEV